VAFLGAAQIDRRGSINTTVVGPYRNPQIRLPGSGGACEIALNAGRVSVIVTQSRRTFFNQLDFVTSPGHLDPKPGRGDGPACVVTQLGTYGFVDGEMTLQSLHPGATVQEVKDSTGWEVEVSDDLVETEAPRSDELETLRALDPDRVYLG
jgi:glutaconate CoA-transferase, subunit B